MNRVPGELKYVKSHEWLRLESDGTVTVGITHHAQELLGDIVFVELPALGQSLSAGGQACVVESVKAASDIYTPIAGKVVATNVDLLTLPEQVNHEPYGGGWFFRLEPTNLADLDGLLTAAQYADEVAAA